jgi:hypothetical protein
MKRHDRLGGDKYLGECLTILKEKAKAGNRAAILIALHQVLLMRRPVPEWLRNAFIAAFQEVAGFESKSWDQAFGNPHPKRARLKARKQYRELRYPIALRVHQRKALDEKIDKGMFDKIAKDLKKTGDAPRISGTTVSDRPLVCVEDDR